MIKSLLQSLLLLVFLSGCDNQPLVSHIVYGTYTPPGHPTARYGLSPWLQNIEKATNGELVTRLYTGGAIVGSHASLSAVRVGLLDGGLIANIYIPDQLPVSMVTTNLAFFSRNSLATAGAINELVLLECLQCLAEFDRQGIVFLGSYASSSYKLMCKGNVETTADLAGLKMRAAGPVFGRWAQALDAVPVTMANSHAYEALERGLLDCVIGSTAWLKSLSLWDLTETIIDMPMGTFFGAPQFMFSKRKWQQFSEQQKTTILRLTPSAIAGTTLGYLRDTESSEVIALSRGIRQIPGDDEMRKRLEVYKRALYERSIAIAVKRGVSEPRKIAEKFLVLLDKWEALIGDKRWDNEAYAQLIWEQIHSKVVVQ